MKNLILMALALSLIISLSLDGYAGEIHKISIAEGQAREIIPDESPQPAAMRRAIPYVPGGIADSPGMIVGSTYYDYQTNGSTGHRIAKHDCGVHICWMKGVTDWAGTRLIYCNYIDPSGTPGWGEDGTPASSGTRDGYTNLDVDRATGNALIAYHDSPQTIVYVGVDAGCGLGLFTNHEVPNQYPGETDFLWPYIASDQGGHIHITDTEGESAGNIPKKIGHTYSADGGSSWQDFQIYDEYACFSTIVVASDVDDKVALVYPKPIDFNPSDPNQFNNDIAYIESTDGATWDYNSIVNITNYRWEDTLRAYADMAACYDYDGNLHIIWNTPYYNADSGTISADACLLWHWSEATGIDMIYDAWYASFPGAWNRSASKMSVSADEQGNLFALWTHFDDIDVSVGGYSNGELYLASSGDGGEIWSDPDNITNSPTEGCFPGDCDSDHWSTMAQKVDENIYITFIEDKDAGGIPQTEGSQTDNPVRYLSIPNPLWMEGVAGEDNGVPNHYYLSQNYPNPFNSSTNIKFNLDKAADVRLAIYNILGEKIAILVDGRIDAGEHTISWDASQFVSGIYFYKFFVNDHSEARRMVLLK